MLRLIHSHIFPAENSWPISYCKHFTSKTLSSSGQRGRDSQPFLFPSQGAFSEKPGGLNLTASVAKDKWVFHSRKTPLVGMNCTLESQEEKQYYTVIQNRDSSQTAWVQILVLPFIMCVWTWATFIQLLQVSFSSFEKMRPTTLKDYDEN